MAGSDVVAAEFFCGIGGLHYALLRAAPAARVVTSIDLNPIGNDVYEHNFGASRSIGVPLHMHVF